MFSDPLADIKWHTLLRDDSKAAALPPLVALSINALSGPSIFIWFMICWRVLGLGRKRSRLSSLRSDARKQRTGCRRHRQYPSQLPDGQRSCFSRSFKIPGGAGNNMRMVTVNHQSVHRRATKRMGCSWIKPDFLHAVRSRGGFTA